MFTFLTGATGDVYTSIGNAFANGIEDMVLGIVGMVTAILPIAVGIIGITLSIGYAKKIITKLAG